MNKLLSANLLRLWKSKIYWFCVFAMLLFSACAMLLGCRQAAILLREGYSRDLDYYYFHTLPYFGFFLSVFAGLFLGTEYSDGTIRNKVVVGCTRTEIYLSNLICCAVATTTIYAAWAIGGLVGIPTLGLWRVGLYGLAEYLVIGLFSVLALAAIFVFIGQLCSNKAITAVLSILAAIVLLLMASMLYNSLCEPETTTSGITISAGGTLDFGEEIANPAYVGGARRVVYQALLNILPMGQAIWIADETVAQPILMIALSVAVIAVLTACGLILFRKKDLK